MDWLGSVGLPQWPVSRVGCGDAATQRQLQGFVSGGVCSARVVWHWGWAPLNVLSDQGPGFTNPKIEMDDDVVVIAAGVVVVRGV